jgi:hypothetical protein
VAQVRRNSDRLSNAFWEAGVPARVVSTLCEELIISRDSDGFEGELLEDFLKDPRRWTRKVEDELKLFETISVFSSNQRFHHEMVKRNRLYYVIEARKLAAMYEQDFERILDDLRSDFKTHVMENLKEWAPILMDWDTHWVLDPEIGVALLDAFSATPRGIKARPCRQIPGLIKDQDQYHKAFLFPDLARIIPNISRGDGKRYARLVNELGVSGYGKGTIEKTVFHGRSTHDGFLKFFDTFRNKHSKDVDSDSLSPLEFAFLMRQMRAKRRVMEFPTAHFPRSADVPIVYAQLLMDKKALRSAGHTL